MGLPLEGGCLCGAVRYRISAAPSHTDYCHCRMCQRSTGAPVVPVGIWGTQDRWPKSGLHYRRPYRRTIAVVYGEPIDPRGDAGSPEDVQVFTDLVMTGVAKQAAEARILASAPR